VRPASDLRQSLLLPQARSAAGRWLAEHGVATAMIGLERRASTDLRIIVEEIRRSGIYAMFCWQAATLCRDDTLRSIRPPFPYGGDEYELLLHGTETCVPPALVEFLWTEIGTVPRQKQMFVISAEVPRRAMVPTRLSPKG